MSIQRSLPLLAALLGLHILVSTGLIGCATSDGSDAPAEPDVAVEVQDEQVRYAELETENAALKGELADLKRQHAELEREKDHLAELVKIATTTVDDWGKILSAQAPPIEAVVQKVNRDLKFVLLSVGRDDKVTKGYRFTISRGGKYVGEVQVDYVYPKASSASFVQIAPGMKFEVGDTANTRL